MNTEVTSFNQLGEWLFRLEACNTDKRLLLNIKNWNITKIYFLLSLTSNTVYQNFGFCLIVNCIPFTFLPDPLDLRRSYIFFLYPSHPSQCNSYFLPQFPSLLSTDLNHSFYRFGLEHPIPRNRFRVVFSNSTDTTLTISQMISPLRRHKATGKKKNQ